MSEQEMPDFMRDYLEKLINDRNNDHPNPDDAWPEMQKLNKQYHEKYEVLKREMSTYKDPPANLKQIFELKKNHIEETTKAEAKQIVEKYGLKEEKETKDLTTEEKKELFKENIKEAAEAKKENEKAREKEEKNDIEEQKDKEAEEDEETKEAKDDKENSSDDNEKEQDKGSDQKEVDQKSTAEKERADLKSAFIAQMKATTERSQTPGKEI